MQATWLPCAYGQGWSSRVDIERVDEQISIALPEPFCHPIRRYLTGMANVHIKL